MASASHPIGSAQAGSTKLAYLVVACLFGLVAQPALSGLGAAVQRVLGDSVAARVPEARLPENVVGSRSQAMAGSAIVDAARAAVRNTIRTQRVADRAAETARLFAKPDADFLRMAGELQGEAGAVAQRYAHLLHQDLTDDVGSLYHLPKQVNTAIGTALAESISNTAYSFDAGRYVVDLDRLDATLAQHQGYATRAIRRLMDEQGVPVADDQLYSIMGRHYRDLLDAEWGSPLVEEVTARTVSAISELAEGAEEALRKGVLENDAESWMFGPWSGSKRDIALNLPGIHASEALLDAGEIIEARLGGASEGLRARALRRLARVTTLGDDETLEMLRAPSPFERIEDWNAASSTVRYSDQALDWLYVQIAARLAQGNWIVSKGGDGIVLAMNGKDAKAVRNWGLDPLIRDYRTMAEATGRLNVMKDIDQFWAYLKFHHPGALD